MDHLFQSALAFRGLLVKRIEPCTDEQLDAIAPGFKNTVRWQLAHMIVTPALLTYKLVGEEAPMISDDFVGSARKGTNQDNFSINEDYGKEHLLEYLIETTKQLQRDAKGLNKKTFQAYETSTGLVLKDLQTAIAYSNIHDGVHFGRIISALIALG